MKKLIALAVLAGGSSAAFASFTESFDTGPTGFIDTTVITFGNSAGGDDLALSSGTWHAQNESAGGPGSTGWFCNPTIWATHSGAGHLSANFNSSTGGNNINSWFMSPMQTFNNGDTISFWARTVDTVSFPDRLILKLSLNGASTTTSDFSTTLLTINPNLTTTGFPSVYTQFSATLSGLGSPTTGRFAFNYNVTNGGPSGNNSDFITVDDVAYTSNAVPEPATMAVLAIGALAMLRRRKKA